MRSQINAEGGFEVVFQGADQRLTHASFSIKIERTSMFNFYAAPKQLIEFCGSFLQFKISALQAFPTHPTEIALLCNQFFVAMQTHICKNQMTQAIRIIFEDQSQSLNICCHCASRFNNSVFKSDFSFLNYSNVNVLTLLRFPFIQKLSFRTHNFLRKNYQNTTKKHVNIFLGHVEIRWRVCPWKVCGFWCWKPQVNVNFFNWFEPKF